MQSPLVSLCICLTFLFASCVGHGLDVTITSSDGVTKLEYSITKTTFEFEIVCSFASGWCAWGINDRQSMIGTDVFWLKADSSGVQIADAYAYGYTNPQIDPIQNIVNVTTFSTGTKFGVRASRLLRTGDSTNDKDILKDGSMQYLIYAYKRDDTASSFSGLSQHAMSSRGSFSVVFSNATITELEEPKQRQAKVHGWFMFISWGVCVPIGILIARYLQPCGTLWFQFHRGLQLFAVVIGIVGIILGFTMPEEHDDDGDGHHHENPTTHYSHFGLGIAVLVLGVLNPIIAFFRPSKYRSASSSPQPNETGTQEVEAGNSSTKKKPTRAPEEQETTLSRKIWYAVHFSLGYAAVICAIYNLFVGTEMYGLEPQLWWAMVGWLCLLALALVIGEVVTWTRRCLGCGGNGEQVRQDPSRTSATQQ